MDCCYLGYKELVFNYAQFSFPDAEFLLWCRAHQCPKQQQGSRCLHPRDLPRYHPGMMVGAESLQASSPSSVQRC